MSGRGPGRPRVHDRFIMRWPIVDKSAPLRDLTAEGRAELMEALALVGVEPLAPPEFKIKHGMTPELLAEVVVRHKVGAGTRGTA
ncbi:hypothetical protein SEA_TAYLORSIPHT_58 [Arthrobacter phage TaylorSipht]|nr:hypothetical protein SEA_TAYLORSIPHT_58 [Arthrobacter phage TaylorSipht]